MGWFSFGILQYEPLPYTRSVSVFFLSTSREIQVERNTKSGIIFFITTVQLIQSKRNLVLNVKGYRSKLTDGRRRLRTFTKRRSVRSLKETIPYNKQLTNLSCSGPNWGILALGLFCTATTLGRYCPVRPSRSVSKRLIWRIHSLISFSLALSERTLCRIVITWYKSAILGRKLRTGTSKTKLVI